MTICVIAESRRPKAESIGLAIARFVGGALMATAAIVLAEPGQQQVSIAVSGGERIVADSYGQGTRGLVLVAHGGYSSRPAWRPQAEALASAGFRVLVLETRGAAMLAKGTETPCLYDAPCMAADVLAAVRYLRGSGKGDIAVVGGSAGGGAAAQASVDAAPGEITHIVLLAPMEIDAPEKIKAKTFYITARNDRGSGDELRLPGIQRQFERAPEPKKFLVVEGSAHGQRMFDSPEGPKIMHEILAFLAER